VFCEIFIGKKKKIEAYIGNNSANKVFNLTAPFVTAFAFAKPVPIASRTGLQVKTALGGRLRRIAI
jgi:hypothetical protein